MSGQITDQQTVRMKDLAQKVKSTFAELAPYEIIHRIATIEKIPIERAITGYKTMRSLGIISDKFVKGGKELEDKILKTFYTPVMINLISQLGLVITEVKNLPKQPEQLTLLTNSDGSRATPEQREAYAQVQQVVEQEKAVDLAKVKRSIANGLLGLDANF